MEARRALGRLSAAALLALSACVGDSTAGAPPGGSPPLVASVRPPAPPRPHHTRTPKPPHPQERVGPDCPHDPLRGVYHRYRLEVLAECRWFRGTVMLVRFEDDGDHHVDLRPVPGERQFLTGANFTITQRAAQAYFDRYPGDPSGLDGDGDGIAGEDNP